MCKEWTDEMYVARAKKEPERIEFWLPYSKTYLEACKAVCDNPPSFDKRWKEVFPSPQSFFRFEKECDDTKNSCNVT